MKIKGKKAQERWGGLFFATSTMLWAHLLKKLICINTRVEGVNWFQAENFIVHVTSNQNLSKSWDKSCHFSILLSLLWFLQCLAHVQTKNQATIIWLSVKA